MRRARTSVAMAVGAVLVLGIACTGQGEAKTTLPLEQRLAGFAARMRLGLSIASVAAFSPTIADARAQAERLFVILRGDAASGIPGLLQEVELFPEWIRARELPPDLARELLGASANMQTFLRLAAETAASARKDRALVGATLNLLRTYASLLAAWGEPIDGVVVPGLVTLLRTFGVPVEV